MEVLRKLGFKDIDDFKYQWSQDTEEVQEIKDLLLELSVGEIRNGSFLKMMNAGQ